MEAFFLTALILGGLWLLARAFNRSQTASDVRKDAHERDFVERREQLVEAGIRARKKRIDALRRAGVPDEDIQREAEEMDAYIGQRSAELARNSKAPPPPHVAELQRLAKRREAFRELAARRDPARWVFQENDCVWIVDFTTMTLFYSWETMSIEHEYRLRRAADGTWSKRMTAECRQAYAIKEASWERCEDEFEAAIEPQYARYLQH